MPTALFFGGIDLGGTKIEAALFDAGFNKIDVRRIDTPCASYQALLEAIQEQCLWLCDQAGEPELSIGIGLPGYFSVETGLYHAANLPASGRPFRSDLEAIRPRIAIGQDLKCFTLSEAHGGAGQGAKQVFGLGLGTGVGGALCVDGDLLHGMQGIAGEIGHLPVGADLAHRHALPIVPCGCGRVGCVETLIAGPGLMRLAEHFGLAVENTRRLFELNAIGDADARKVVDVWLDLTAQTLLTIQMAVDPDVIVLGGGLSNVQDVEQWLQDRLAGVVLKGTTAPEIRKAHFGDASGVRGAAILAAQKSGLKT